MDGLPTCPGLSVPGRKDGSCSSEPLRHQDPVVTRAFFPWTPRWYRGPRGAAHLNGQAAVTHGPSTGTLRVPRSREG